jgi:pimeloyl-ACP methyl ester carboxylesterase
MTTGLSEPAAVGAAFIQRAVDADGFTIRYFEAGDGEPLVVLHGAGGPRFSLALDILASTRRVILVEMPGFGDQANDRHQTLAELAETVAEAVAGIGLQTYHLLGTSFGGAVAVNLAVAHPDRVSSMVLEGPAAFRVGATPPDPSAPPEDMLRRFRRHPERIPAFEPPDPQAMARTWPLVDRLLASTPEFDEQLAARLPECAVRTLVVFGDEDGIIPPANGRTFRQLMPNCSYVLVHQAAHDVQGDRAQAFSELVGDFLDRGWNFLLPEQPTLLNP